MNAIVSTGHWANDSLGEVLFSFYVLSQEQHQRRSFYSMTNRANKKTNTKKMYMNIEIHK